MQEVYDRERTAALVKEAQDIIAALKCEASEIATQMARVLSGPEDDDDPDRRRRVPPPLPIMQPIMQRETRPRPFWRFWR
jgi:hypothetical protein